MSSKKLIFNHNDDDSEPESLMSRCFQISPNVQYREVPTTGEEYLLCVRRERERYAAVSSCEQDYSKFDTDKDCFIEEVILKFLVSIGDLEAKYIHNLYSD